MLWILLLILALAGQVQAKSDSKLQRTPDRPDSAAANQPQLPNKPAGPSVDELQRMIAERDTTIAELRSRLDRFIESDTADSDRSPESDKKDKLSAIKYALMSERAILSEPGEWGFEFELGYEHFEQYSQSWWTTQFSGLVGFPKDMQFEFSLSYSANAADGLGASGDVWMGLVKAFRLRDNRNSPLLNLFAGNRFSSLPGNNSIDVGLSFSWRVDPMMFFGGLAALWPLPGKLSSYEVVIHIGSELALTPETALSTSLAIGRFPPPPRDEDDTQEQKLIFATVDFSLYWVLTRSLGLKIGLGVKAIGYVPDLQVTLAVPINF